MRSIIFVFIWALAFTTGCSAQKQLKVDDLVGDWFGESKCAGNNPSCHDEVVRYRFSAIKGEEKKVHLAADKQVNGEWDPMGEFDLTIDTAKSTLATEFTIARTGGRGEWSFTVAGDKIDGTL